MPGELSGVTVAVLGGDNREVEVVREFLREGAAVRVAGHAPRPELDGAMLVETLDEAVSGASVVVAPLPGTDVKGFVYAPHAAVPLQLSEDVLRKVQVGTPFFIGTAKPLVRELAARAGLRLVELAEADELAILNSIPSAEGAIQIAMEQLPITIHGSDCAVLGFGRLGRTLARMLRGIGARTRVVARDRADLARAYEMGFETAPFARLAESIRETDIVFNTVPALVLTREVLQCARPEVFLLDLASAPGGIDFEAASELGLRAMLAPGLPGKVAPKTAGKMLASVLCRLVKEALGR